MCSNHSNPKPSFCGELPPAEGCNVGYFQVKISVTTDNYPWENTWIVHSTEAGVIANSGVFISRGEEYTSEYCLPSTACYTFTIYDDWGDGIKNDGDFTLSVDNNVILAKDQSSGGFFRLKAQFGPCDFSPAPSTSFTPTELPSSAPMVSVPAPTPSPPSVSKACSNPRKERFVLYLKTDRKGSETSFKVFQRRKNKFTKQKYQGANFKNKIKEYTRQKCLLKNKCYKFVIYDSNGDGMCCSKGRGIFQGYWAGE